jgi:hypothetical protein
MAQGVIRRPVTAESAPGSFHVLFVVNNVTLGQVSHRAVRFSHVCVIQPWLSIIIYHLGDEQ